MGYIITGLVISQRLLAIDEKQLRVIINHARNISVAQYYLGVING
jgi:hypothetical protein